MDASYKNGRAVAVIINRIATSINCHYYCRLCFLLHSNGNDNYD